MGMILHKDFFQPGLLKNPFAHKIFTDSSLLRPLKGQEGLYLTGSQQAFSNGPFAERLPIRGLEQGDDIFAAEPAEPPADIPETRPAAALPDQGLDNTLPAYQTRIIEKVTKEQRPVRKPAHKEVLLGTVMGMTGPGAFWAMKGWTGRFFVLLAGLGLFLAEIRLGRGWAPRLFNRRRRSLPGRGRSSHGQPETLFPGIKIDTQILIGLLYCLKLLGAAILGQPTLTRQEIRMGLFGPLPVGAFHPGHLDILQKVAGDTQLISENHLTGMEQLLFNNNGSHFDLLAAVMSKRAHDPGGQGKMGTAQGEETRRGDGKSSKKTLFLRPGNDPSISPPSRKYVEKLTRYLLRYKIHLPVEKIY